MCSASRAQQNKHMCPTTSKALVPRRGITNAQSFHAHSNTPEELHLPRNAECPCPPKEKLHVPHHPQCLSPAQKKYMCPCHAKCPLPPTEITCAPPCQVPLLPLPHQSNHMSPAMPSALALLRQIKNAPPFRMPYPYPYPYSSPCHWLYSCCCS